MFMDKSKQMSSVMNRLIELTGWIVLVVSVILLGVANHIDNYQPPEPVAAVQKNKYTQPVIAWQLTPR
ncbi:beta-lactam resistance membrane protein [Shigella flexneri 1235-66]|nr:beta-lactam resistance membrane protein [Shigella flexneri 1235-66]